MCLWASQARNVGPGGVQGKNDTREARTSAIQKNIQDSLDQTSKSFAKCILACTSRTQHHSPFLQALNAIPRAVTCPQVTLSNTKLPNRTKAMMQWPAHCLPAPSTCPCFVQTTSVLPTCRGKEALTSLTSSPQNSPKRRAFNKCFCQHFCQLDYVNRQDFNCINFVYRTLLGMLGTNKKLACNLHW